MNQRLKTQEQKMRSKEMETSRNKEKKKIPSLNNSFSHPNVSFQSRLGWHFALH
jgi:hypothetical protein